MHAIESETYRQVYGASHRLSYEQMGVTEVGPNPRLSELRRARLDAIAVAMLLELVCFAVWFFCQIDIVIFVMTAALFIIPCFFIFVVREVNKEIDDEPTMTSKRIATVIASQVVALAPQAHLTNLNGRDQKAIELVCDLAALGDLNTLPEDVRADLTRRIIDVTTNTSAVDDYRSRMLEA